MRIWYYFKYAFIITFFGLLTSYFIGYQISGYRGGLLSLFSCVILALLEISLSFDNAIVNARIVNKMSPRWQKAFLFWGILIAVFGMRIILPIVIVMFITKLGFLTVAQMALFSPVSYMHALEQAHISLDVLGGSFLAMVAMNFFFDQEREDFWLAPIEKFFQYAGKYKIIPFFINLLLASFVFVIFICSKNYSYLQGKNFIISFVISLILFYVMKALSHEPTGDVDSVPKKGWLSAGLKSFLYLELLDASFSFDGVLGAFALSENFLIISLGLAIGSFYVRSMTLMLVEQDTLLRYKYIEHGAFYAIFLLALTMYCKVNFEVPDYISGGLSVIAIGCSIWSSIAENKSSKSE